ncbi:hypothetical protein FPV67DRAFT_286730 [Lyophyllum atratum]|nr:hypothetical protein FPV67DRAFT_286730 [Lyophyllum atratum]
MRDGEGKRRTKFPSDSNRLSTTPALPCPKANLKRKQPPTFRHLPLNRAKKLKQTWVENTKIKSKWKAQKRREGLSAAPTGEISRLGNEEDLDAERSGSGSEQGDEEDQEETLEPEERKKNRHQ